MTPTALTLRDLRANGWEAAVVERWNPYARIRQDLFGIIDIIAVKPGCGVMGVQATSDANVSARVNKAKAEPRLKSWLGAGCRFTVVGWKKRNNRWGARWVEFPLKEEAPEPTLNFGSEQNNDV